jgi:hypothetical protein
MEILGAIALFYAGVFNPQWFDKGPYEYVNTYTTVEQCQAAGAKGDICTTEVPFQLYTKVGQGFEEDYRNTADLEWVECDHHFGCYNKPNVVTKSHRPDYGLKYGMKSLVFNPQEDPDSFK